MVVLGLVGASAGCVRKTPEEAPKVREEPTLAPGTYELVEDEYDIRVLPRDQFELLEPLYFPDLDGEGYRRVGVEYGPPLYSGKHLRIARGDSRFLGERHVIVTEYPKRPKHPRHDPIAGNVIVDIDTGEVVAEFAKRVRVNWTYGFAIVRQEGDPTPWLFTPSAGGLVRALPEGEHGYEWGKNYWLRISAIAPRVWISAKDEAGQAHIYEWEDLSKAPPLPDNPVDFVPREWYPMHSEWLIDVDHEEVMNIEGEACEHAILEPPRGFHCLDFTLSAGTDPVGHGWQFDRSNGTVFEQAKPEERLSLAELCPEGTKLNMQALQNSMLKLTCRGDNTVWAVWSPPERVRVLDPELAFHVNGPPTVPNEPLAAGFDWENVVPRVAIDQFERLADEPDDVHTIFSLERGARELVGLDYKCDELRRVRGSRSVYGVECTGRGRQWIDVVDMTTRTRARLKSVVDLAVSIGSRRVVIRQQAGKEHLLVVHAPKVK